MHARSRCCRPVQRSTGMTRALTCGLAFVVALAARAVFAQDAPAPDAALDAAFGALKTLDLGQSLDAFQPIEQAVARAHADEKVRADLEARLAAVLGGEATDLARDYACRQLALVGSDASVPALAALLPKPRSSYMARYALEGIGSPAATKALRDAIGTTTGPARVGVVISLGRLADAEAAGPIAALLGEEDPALREAAVIALGRIGTAEAAAALQAFAAKAPEALRHAVVAAELQAAERLCRQGSTDVAIKLYESLAVVRVRAGSRRRLPRAHLGQAVRIRGDDPRRTGRRRRLETSGRGRLSRGPGDAGRDRDGRRRRAETPARGQGGRVRLSEIAYPSGDSRGGAGIAGGRGRGRSRGRRRDAGQLRHGRGRARVGPAGVDGRRRPERRRVRDTAAA